MRLPDWASSKHGQMLAVAPGGCSPILDHPLIVSLHILVHLESSFLAYIFGLLDNGLSDTRKLPHRILQHRC